jgi:hypothetical protein
MRHGRPSRLARVRALTVVGVRAGASVLLMAGAWSLYVATAASASTTNGTATITDPSNSPLATGGSSTSFTVELPAQAACTGDSASDGYEVYSYLVPQGTSPTAITFTGGDPSTGYGFFSSIGTYYGAANTAPTTGQIIGIPDFEWGPAVESDSLLSILLAGGGVWEAGIACANSSGVVTDWWNTEITFTANSSDPDGFTWSDVPGLPGTTPTTTSTTSGASGTTTTTSDTSGTTTSTTSSTSGTSGPTTTSGTSGTSGTTTSTTLGAATQSGSSTDSDSTTAGDPSTAAGDPSTASGTLASTGAPIVRDLALGLLCIGLGLILLGWSATSRWARAALPTGEWP